MCRGSDPTCVSSDANTFVVKIFQWKSYYEFHSFCEPYFMLYSVALRNPSTPSPNSLLDPRPRALAKVTGSLQYEGKSEDEIPKSWTELFCTTRMGWQSHVQRYHGYIDDVLFPAFGIEDSRPATIDVLAGDLLQDLAFCTG